MFYHNLEVRDLRIESTVREAKRNIMLSLIAKSEHKWETNNNVVSASQM